MRVPVRQRIRLAVFAAACLAALAISARPMQAGDLLLPLAQAAPAPVQVPSNVTAPARYYIVEGIVIVLLFAGAVFAVCRTSGRT